MHMRKERLELIRNITVLNLLLNTLISKSNGKEIFGTKEKLKQRQIQSGDDRGD